MQHLSLGNYTFTCPLGDDRGLFENDCLRYVCLAEFT